MPITNLSTDRAPVIYCMVVRVIAEVNKYSKAKYACIELNISARFLLDHSLNS